MKRLVWFLIFLLLVLHQDNWFWGDPTLCAGFLPIGLLYHVGISLAAGVLWFLATRFCWPQALEIFDDAAPPRWVTDANTGAPADTDFNVGDEDGDA